MENPTIPPLFARMSCIGIEFKISKFLAKVTDPNHVTQLANSTLYIYIYIYVWAIDLCADHI